jgi:hypothetical protein
MTRTEPRVALGIVANGNHVAADVVDRVKRFLG